jgi:hypothetical protein
VRPRSRSPLRVALLLVLALAGGGLGGRADAARAATGDGSPVVVGPDGSSPQYQGFAGPFSVDFSDAPTGTYSCRVEQAGATVASCGDQFVWDGTGGGQHAFRTSVVPPGASTFVLHQESFEFPDTTLGFTVRGYGRPTCSVSVPQDVRVDADEEIVTGRLTAGCTAAHATYASWEVEHVTRGFRSWMTFDHTTTDRFSFFGADPLGTYLVDPLTATNAAADDIAQNTPRIEVRLDSRLTLRSHRSGSRVELTARFTRFVRGANRFGGWAHRPVTFAERSCGTCAWKRLSLRRTDSHGQVRLGLRAHRVRAYRVTAGGAALVWAPYPRYTRR